MKTTMVFLYLCICVFCFAKTEIPVTRVNHPMTIDGLEDDWKDIPRLPEPVTYSPEEGKDPCYETEARIAYDDKYFYVLFISEIDDPDDLIATVATRENWDNDEQVVFAIDVFNSDRGAYLFNFNPYGNPKDWISSAAGPSDMNWNIPLKSKSQIYQDRYVVEVAIPFASLPFDDTQEEQRWGFYYFRLDKTHNEQSVYPPRTHQMQNIFAQSGVLTGMRNIKSGRQLDLRPYVFGSYLRDGKKRKLDTGIDASYSLNPRLTLSATINPDYSQIEADPMNVDINKRDPTWLQEKRPFFTQGMDFFYTNLFELVYTRNIVNPVAGAKLSGKYPSSSFGYVSAYDEGVDDDSKELYNLFRYRLDVLDESTVGVLLTDREDMGSSAFNRVAAVDGFYSFPLNIRIKSQTAVSFDSLKTEQEVEGRDGYERGWAHNTTVEHNGEHSYNDFWIEAISKNFEPGSGYMSSLSKDRYQLGTHNKYDILEGNNWWNEVEVYFGMKNFYDMQNEPLEEFIWVGIWADWKSVGNSELKIEINNNRHEYVDESGNVQAKDLSTVRYVLENWKMFSGSFRAWLNGSFGTEPYFDGEGFEGWSYFLESGFSLDLFDRMSISPNVQVTDFYEEFGGDRVYKYYTVWNRVTFLISQNLYIRNITQGMFQRTYDLDTRESYSETEYSNSLLLTWEYSPLSNIYFGVNLVEFDRFDRLEDHVQLFFKGNYLWTL